MPVVSRTYFKREQCRRELLDPAKEAESLGLTELICPILYSQVADMTEENPDPAIRLAAAAQHEDWTRLRLEDPELFSPPQGCNQAG